MNKPKLLKPQSAKLEVLVQHHARFLRFLLPRVNDASIAEDILHSAYLKALEHENQLQADESVVAWFYRILRNSLIDHYRRNAARDSAHSRYASELPVSYETELRQHVCACVTDVIGGLKPDYREAIEGVDLAEESVEQFAKAKRITSNNASVRLHRARKALASKLTEVCGVCAEHKCVDCTCRRAGL
jgi:RNA polymerase sigma-70 factor (ECF subfamily)